MGLAPSRPDDETIQSLRDGSHLVAVRAAAAIASADILLVTIGEGLGEGLLCYSCAERGVGRDMADLERFYGFWGHLFNETRKKPAHEAYRYVSKWCTERFEGTATATEVKRRAALAGSPEEGESVPHTGSWKRCGALGNALRGSGEIVIDLGTASDEEDDEDSGDEALSQLPYDSHAPSRAGAFHVFTSLVDGHAARMLGSHVVRECRGSVQLWQCGAAGGPCRDSDAWEAPEGFAFRTDATPAGRLAPVGVPEARPPVFAVPMYNGGCMDRALSVAAGFKDNWPVCRSCAAAPARPALLLGPSDAAGWSDLDDRRERYAKWRRVALGLAKEGRARVVVLELGGEPAPPCGPCQYCDSAARRDARGSDRAWTAVRQESESFACEVLASGSPAEPASVTLVRVSDSLPLADRPEAAACTLSLCMPAVEALAAIDRELGALRKQG